MLKKIEDIDFIFVHRIVEAPRGLRNLSGEDQKQQDVRNVHLRRPPIPESLGIAAST
jgi:hypothetical protein